MRGARILFAGLTALAVSGCMRAEQPQQAYYIMDPQTGQMVPVASPQQQQFTQSPQYAQQVYPTPGQMAQQPAAPQASSRGLYSRSPGYAQQQYAPPQQYAAPPQNGALIDALPPAGVQPRMSPSSAPASEGNRGFFTSPSSSNGAPVYAQQYQQVQPRVLQQAPRPVQQPYIAQYTPPQPVIVQQAPVQVQAQAPVIVRQAPTAAYAAAPANYQADYTLDSGDKLRVVVFGQDGITNSYMVDAGGNINLPLIGAVPTRGGSTQQLSRVIAAKLKQGFVRDPSVSVEIEAYRPFFILGEVTTPGQYPYVANMTAETAIAIAGGFAPRANKGKVQVTRNTPGQQFNGEVPLNFPLKPGDSVVVKERWF